MTLPDIDPAALSRPAASDSTPVLSTKLLSVATPGNQKTAKSSQMIPARIDLESLYIALKAAITSERWLQYKQATSEFLIGHLSQAEYSGRINPILYGDNGEKEHLHNQLVAAILGNVTREMPDQGVAPWVSANDKPLAAAASKPVSGDAAERKLKGEVMQLPARDRRRIKDLVQNDYDSHESTITILSDAFRRVSATGDVPQSAAGGISKINFELEIRKRYTQPLAVESGEFPDVGPISGRMLPSCYEAGLTGGHVADAPQYMSVAADTFIKEVLTQVFSRTRCNGPGDSGCAGFDIGTAWVQRHKYRRQLRLEEEAAQRGEMGRDKSGLLPVEAKAAGERGPLGVADMRIALELADTGLAHCPVLMAQILYGYREGELENWNDYTWANGKPPVAEELFGSREVAPLANGHVDPMEVDDDPLWDGAEKMDMDHLDGILDSCLAVGS